MKNALDSHALFKRIVKKDSLAFTEFYNLYFDRIYRIAFYYIKSKSNCEEIVSDVFMTIWESGQKLLEVKDIDSYLYIITRNRAYYYLNKNNPTHSVSVEDIPFESLFHTETPEELSITNEFRQKIDEAINDLPERCREIFLLAREEGLKYKEIASKLSLSEKTVNAQMVTAIKRIGNALRQFITFLF